MLFFLLSLLHVIFDYGVEEKIHLSDYLKGIEEVKEIVKEYSPQKNCSYNWYRYFRDRKKLQKIL